MDDHDTSELPRVMLVDDEPMVLEVSSLMVESLGYTVDAFLSPTEALQNFAENSDAYLLVIIDMMMPDISGKDLFIKLKEINPDVIGVISSGYQLNQSHPELAALGIQGFIDKPFTIEILKTSLNKILQK
ncbi:MAG: response regulator [Gammaproteobacteria bacterium]|nr:response regulator [Gammaproteobacteria bacterium]NNJ73186.1 response regulator [Enterobacterales bacterium]